MQPLLAQYPLLITKTVIFSPDKCDRLSDQVCHRSNTPFTYQESVCLWPHERDICPDTLYLDSVRSPVIFN
jgi:hypothetical protein